MSLTNVLKIQLKVSDAEHHEAVKTGHSPLSVFSPVKWCNTCQILQRCYKCESIVCKTLRSWTFGNIRKILWEN